MIRACGLFERFRFFIALWIGPHRLRCLALIEFDLRFLEFFILFTVFYSFLYFYLDFILFYTFLSILAGSKHGLLSCLLPYTWFRLAQVGQFFLNAFSTSYLTPTLPSEGRYSSVW